MRSEIVHSYVSWNLSFQVCGLCGNYNDDPNDEYFTLDGQQASNYADFANAWLDPTEKRVIEQLKPRFEHPCKQLNQDEVLIIHFHEV